jgi:hypothetical protein
MKRTIFNNEECYIAYKGLTLRDDKLYNFKNNYVYELNSWYESLDVDMSDEECSYGLNLCHKWDTNFTFGNNVYICYVPIENNTIKFIEDADKFRCKRFYLTDQEPSEFTDYGKYWSELTEEQIDLICAYNHNFEYKEYWNELTEYQKDFICSYNPNFDVEKYWDELTEPQKDNICIYNSNFDYNKYWSQLTKKQRMLLKQRIVIKTS